MNWYDDLLACDDSEPKWVESSKGNHCLIIDDTIAATVYRKLETYDWSIIVNRKGVGHFVANEGFDKLPAAMERAEAIVNGAEAILVEMQPRGQRGQRRAR
jgi:hypothetical protein